MGVLRLLSGITVRMIFIDLCRSFYNNVKGNADVRMVRNRAIANDDSKISSKIKNFSNFADHVYFQEQQR